MSDIVEPGEEEVDNGIYSEVASLFPNKVGWAINSLDPKFRQLSEAELMDELEPTPLDYAVRRSFWNAVEKYKALGKKKIPAARIYEGVCARGYFEESFLIQPLRIAWMCRPIVPHETYYEAINRAVLQKLLAYIRTTPVSEKNLAAILKLAENSANRAFGAVVQKIQTKNLNLEARVAEPLSVPAADQAQLEQRAQELHAKLLSQAKDVTPVEKD